MTKVATCQTIPRSAEESAQMHELASASKLAWHRDKLLAYLRGEPIFPATIELDLTTECGRGCPICPSTTSPRSSHLHMHFVKRLFGWAEGHTQGLILSGGEPTLACTFHETLSLARVHGFTDVVVVTNGSRLEDRTVQAALLADASAVRVSLYDWTAQSLDGLAPTWKRIEDLRSLVEREGSSLQIGVSALTHHDNATVLGDVAQQASHAGAHWIYFHPMCVRWDVGAPERVDQSGVLAKIKECQKEQSDAFRVFTFPDRYFERKIEFSGYHAAHFLLVIGADGMNYLGAEVKYHPQYIIADLTNNWRDDFLWNAERLNKIKSVDSRTYPAIASRHRGIMYSQIIQKLMDKGIRSLERPAADTYLFPHIL